MSDGEPGGERDTRRARGLLRLLKPHALKWLFALAAYYFENFVVEAKIGGKLGSLAKIPRAVGRLGPGARLVAMLCLLLLAALVGATFAMLSSPDRFAALAWTDGGARVSLPVVALHLTLAGWALSSAVVLAASAHSGTGFLVTVGLVQLVAVVFSAFPGGKAYWLAAPSWLLPIAAATSPAIARRPAIRPMAIVGLCALAAWHTYRFTPLSSGGAPPRVGWLVVLFAVASLLLLRVRVRLGLGALFGLGLVVNAALLAAALARAGDLAVAQGLVVPAAFFIGLFGALWFALGAELVNGAVSMAHFAIRLVTTALPIRVLPFLLGLVFLAEVALAPWIDPRLSGTDQFALLVHRPVTAALLLIAIVLAVRRCLDESWARALLAIWVFSGVALRAYFSGVSDVAALAESPETGTVALTLFALAIAMQVVKRLIEAPEDEPRDARADARLLLPLGLLTFLATGTHFEFAIRNPEVMREAAVSQWSGATALFLPVLLALLVAEQRWLPAPPRALLGRAFLLGFLGAFAVQLLRVATVGPGGFGFGAHLGAVALGQAVTLVLIAWLVALAGAWTPVDAAAAAIACALGFAVGAAQNLTVLALDSAAKLAMMLTARVPGVSEATSALVDGYVRVQPVRPAADHYWLFVGALLPAAVAGVTIARAVRERRPSLAAGGAAAAGALALALAWVTYRQPLLMTESRDPVPFYVVATDPGAIACLLVPMISLAAWLYATVWRPERMRVAEREPDLAGAPALALRAETRAPQFETRSPRRQRRRFATASGAAIVAIALGAGGLAAALASPSPLQTYRDPQGRFAIDYPRGWQTQVAPTGETRFFVDDPRNGALLMLHPGVPLSAGVTAEQLVQGLVRQIRAQYPDLQIGARGTPPRAVGAATVQDIELDATWTVPEKGRLRAKTTLAIVTGGDQPGFSYVTYQVPAGAPASLEGLLARAAKTYRAGNPG